MAAKPMQNNISRPRSRQVRRKSRHRHPRFYWREIKNVDKELRQFWTSLGVTLVDQEPTAIPNEALLNHFERNDLRGAIVSYGGRKSLSAQLGGARIVHGRWTVAVRECHELQQLLRNSTHGLSPDLSPLSPQQKKLKNPRMPTRWAHSERRKPRDFWTLELVLKELYHYLDDYEERFNRPSIWMPRPSEFKRMGRDDLRQAIVRFGGSSRICRLAGLVTYREWNYFEGQYEMLVSLRDYLDKYYNGSREDFPVATAIKRNGYAQLYGLIQYYGGCKFLANRLSMKYIHANADRNSELNWGPFSIDTAIDLLRFIREDQMAKKGPLKRPSIAIPSQRKLKEKGEENLHDQIMELGGYESVARRLGLEYFDTW